ncbi:hypothetical protein HED63_22815 [Ochrobactrum cytisi]|nr:hypothetical protein [Brucella cytisi]
MVYLLAIGGLGFGYIPTRHIDLRGRPCPGNRGGILAARTLIWNMGYDQEMGGFLDVYSGPVFIFAAAISGLWVVALLRKKKQS